MNTKSREEALQMCKSNYDYVKDLQLSSDSDKNLTDVILRIKKDRQLDDLVLRLVKTNNSLIRALEVKPLIKVKK
jgi:hypothetical protein